MHDIAVEIEIIGVIKGRADGVDLVAGPEALALFVEDGGGQFKGILVAYFPIPGVELFGVVAEKVRELIVFGLVQLAAVFVEPAQGILDEIIAQGKAFVELALTAAGEFHDEQVVEQGIGFLDEELGQSPVVVALLEGALEQLIGYVDGFAHPADV